MACLAMHLAIAKKYLETNPKEDYEEITKGSYLPDIAEDKIISHYGKRIKINTIKDMLDSKVDIIKCIKATNLDESLSRGKFLHLLTDFLFYNFVYSKGINNISPSEIGKMMYQDYDFVTGYIIKNYKIEIPKEVSHLVTNKEGLSSEIFFTIKEIDKFIEILSNYNLGKCKDLLIEDKNKFLQDFLKEMKV